MNINKCPICNCKLIEVNINQNKDRFYCNNCKKTFSYKEIVKVNVDDYRCNGCI